MYRLITLLELSCLKLERNQVKHYSSSIVVGSSPSQCFFYISIQIYQHIVNLSQKFQTILTRSANVVQSGISHCDFLGFWIHGK